MRPRLIAGLAIAAVIMSAGTASAVPEGPTVTPGRKGIKTEINAPGSPGGGPGEVPARKTGGAAGAGSCVSGRAPELDLAGPPVLLAYRRSCDRSTFTPESCQFCEVSWRPEGAPASSAAVEVTPALLAQRAVGELVLPAPVVRRSPVESNEYKGDPFTWVNLWTWFWTDSSAFGPLTQTTSLGPVSATVTARPVGLVFDPGDGGPVVRCAGPGVAWTDRFGDERPPTGCGYQYRGVTDGPVTTSLGMVWQVSWTGSGGAGGTLPPMTTTTESPLRVLQVQVVNR